MKLPQALPVALGVVASASGAAMLSTNISLSVALSHVNAPSNTRIAAVVACAPSLVAFSTLMLLVGRQIRYRNGAHVRDIGRGPQSTYFLAGFGALFCVFSTVATAVALGIMVAQIDNLPTTLLSSPTNSLVAGDFVLLAIFLLSSGIYLVCTVVFQRQSLQPYGSQFGQEAHTTGSSEMKSSRPYSAGATITERGANSSDSSNSPRSRSDTLASLRSSLSIVVRPISSRTRLISSAQKMACRPTSTDSGYRDTMVEVDNGFDSWDTSAVDPQARQAVMDSGSPTPTAPRREQFPLETIPASPTTSRSASPGFPLDLEPPQSRQRARSFSPANSFVEHRVDMRTSSPTPSLREAHIHPLFRTDSPEPPPAATPGTIITASPISGQVLSSRSSVRSLRMRSGSLPASPLVHSDSLDSIRRAMEREDRELEETGGERTLTPPIPDRVMGATIPDYIMSAGPRNSMNVYNARRKPQVGLGKVGEAGES
ncbi:hypothetical protein PVAG01_04030 [Phlyctema vagabunda]|uniref:Uncharacterized protein n=1 Tax=Phlyctema vagabunda TaxID=108571 RepID=A0ABR4PN51_9HELO